jgi:uncharacterized protein YecE (DUF72 family)
MTSRRVLVGVAGWAIPARDQLSFPDAGSHLQRYATRLNAVEINSSFNRAHRRATYERWRQSVPPGFQFSVKMPRAVTHESALDPPDEELDEFIAGVKGLGPTLGVLLIQLPPSHEFTLARTRSFFRRLRARVTCQVACEPRHVSWSSRRAETLLREFRVARVAADPPLWPGADEPGGARQIAYFRLHGSPRRYYSDYSAERLAVVQERLAAASAESPEVWCIFDNTAQGCATGNALRIADGTSLARLRLMPAGAQRAKRRRPASR